VIDQNVPDDLRAKGKEVYAVFAPDALRANQFQVRLVDQGGGFQRLGAACQIQPGDPSELGVNHWDQPAQSLLVAFAPGHQ
jgi:hypothetical protein